MKIQFPYDDIPLVEVPDSRLMAVVGPADRPATSPPEVLLRDALDHPLESPRLRDLGRRAQRVLILVDDNTRPTPARLIVPWVLEELGPSVDVAFLVASGTHRSMTLAEKQDKLGEDICRRYPILDHEWREPSELVALGRTASGIPVEVNRLLMETDLLLGIGHVAPYRIAGFGGGSKIVQPGVCGAATSGRTNWAAACLAGADVMGVAENPIRAEMDGVAAIAGLDAPS